MYFSSIRLGVLHNSLFISTNQINLICNLVWSSQTRHPNISMSVWDKYDITVRPVINYIDLCGDGI